MYVVLNMLFFNGDAFKEVFLMFLGILVVPLEEILGIFDFLAAFSGGLLATFGRRVRLYFACLDALWDKYGPIHHPRLNFGPR